MRINEPEKLRVILPENFVDKMRRMKELSKEEQYRLLTTDHLQRDSEEDSEE